MLIIASILSVKNLLATDAEQQLVLPPANQYTIASWDEILSGDREKTQADFDKLNSISQDLTPEVAKLAQDMATEIAQAELTGIQIPKYRYYWPPTPTTTIKPVPQCSTVQVQAVSPAALPVVLNNKEDRNTYIKALVVFSGTCEDTQYTTAYPNSHYIYLSSTNQGLAPIRVWNIPGANQTENTGQSNLPASWQLTDINACVVDDKTYKMRTLPASAFTTMCQDAKKESTVLVVSEAYRTPEQQKELFDEALEYYGSKEEALSWVAYSDGTKCASKHCEGLAINIEPDNAALKWLRQTVGCLNQTTREIVEATECSEVQLPIQRMQKYGFSEPFPRLPGYLEFVLPTGDDTSVTPDCNPVGGTVQQNVAAIFRCRLSAAGIDTLKTQTAVSEALVIAQCASGWNASTVAYGGRYVNEPNPNDGRLYTEKGVFALRDEIFTSSWATGDALNAVDNINAAASLWLATQDFSAFACASGTDTGFDVGPVLPQYGGPSLPDWVYDY